MSRTLKQIRVITVLLVLAACDPPNEGAFELPNTPSRPESKIGLSYISGHLGSTWDCSQPGVRIGKTSAAFKAASGQSAAAEGFADDACLQPCGPMNCDDGTIMLQLQNTGDTIISGLIVTDLQLIRADGTELADLPVEAVTVVDGSDVLMKDDIATLRIEFKAPHSADIVNEEVLKLRVIIVSDEGADAELVTPEVQILPMMAT